MDAVFCADAAQEALARARGIIAPIITGARFHRAEDYHQKYHLRHDRRLMAELADYSPDQLADSRVAARLNGLVAGHGTPALLEAELASYGLSADAATYVEQLVLQRARVRRA